MADPLSIAASLAGLITITVQAGSILLDTYGRITSAPSSILQLNGELGALRSILERLQSFAIAKPDDDTNIRGILLGNELADVIQDCHRIMEELTGIMERVGDPRNGPKTSSLWKRKWKDVKWVTLEGDISRLKSQIDTHKATFSLALQFVSAYDMAQVKKRTEQMNLRAVNMERTLEEVRSMLKEAISSHGKYANPPALPSVENTVAILESYISSVETVYQDSLYDETSTWDISESTDETGEYESIVRSTEQRVEEDTFKPQDLGNWLGVIDQHTYYHRFLGMRQSNSHLWLFEEPTLKHWFSLRPGYSLLWLNGPAGAGKSVLASSVVEHAQSQSNATTAFFFFDYRREEAQSATSCTKSLLKQIFEQNTDLSHMAKPYFLGSKASNSFEVYKSLLFNVLGTIGVTYIILDGIDECSRDDQQQLLDLVLELQRLNIRTCRVWLSGRLEPVFRNGLKNEAVWITMDSSMSKDIDAYVRKSMSGLSRMIGSKEQMEEIAQTIVENAEGNFLYARLVIKRMLQATTRQGVLQLVKNTPQGIENLLRWTPKAIPDAEPNLSPECIKRRQILQAIIESPHPLTVNDLMEQTHCEDELIIMGLVSDIGDLVEVTPEGIVRCRNESVKDIIRGYLSHTKDYPVKAALEHAVADEKQSMIEKVANTDQ